MRGGMYTMRDATRMVDRPARGNLYRLGRINPRKNLTMATWLRLWAQDATAEAGDAPSFVHPKDGSTAVDFRKMWFCGILSRNVRSVDEFPYHGHVQ